MSRSTLSRAEAGVLRVLRDCAVGLQGWRRRDSRGWLFTDELPAGAAAVVVRLAKRGLIRSERVPEPGGRTGLVLHRVTTAGEEALARWEGRRPAAVPEPPCHDEPPDAEVVYLPAGAWAALHVLQHPRHASGWTSLAELRLRAVPHAACADDLIYLCRRRLAASGRAPGRVPREPGRYVRATPAGAALRLLDVRTANDDLRGFHRIQATTAPEPRGLPDLHLRLYGEHLLFGSGG